MLDLVTAKRFLKPMASGRTRPYLLTCEREDGRNIDVVAKVSHNCDQHVNALIAEAISAVLATDLGLNVPEPFLVELSQSFIEAVDMSHPDVAHAMQQSAPVAFGSKLLDAGFSTIPNEFRIPPALQQQATEIISYDLLVQNPDRRPNNPNCLSDGQDFAIIDHELALITSGIIGWQPPWVVGGLSCSPATHIFFHDLHSQVGAANFQAILQRWSEIPSTRLVSYQSALPPEWTAGFGFANECIEYLLNLNSNIDASFSEVVKVLG